MIYVIGYYLTSLLEIAATIIMIANNWSGGGGGGGGRYGGQGKELTNEVAWWNEGMERSVVPRDGEVKW